MVSRGDELQLMNSTCIAHLKRKMLFVKGRTCHGLHAVASNISCRLNTTITTKSSSLAQNPLSLSPAEVRGFQHDGLHLQARSQKYGKLERGQLLCISPYLVKRRKQHFHHLVQYGIDLILGVNGFIWIGEHVAAKDEMVVDQIDKSEEQSANPEGSETYEQGKSHTPLEIRQYICRVANAVRVLSTLDFMVTVEVITEIVDLSISQNHEIHDMLGAEFYVLVAEKEVQWRLSTKKR